MPVLRDVLLMPNISPIANNIISSMIMVLYFRCVIEFVCWLRVRFGITRQSRQLLQIFLSSSVIFWPLFDVSEWSWKLNVVLPMTMLVRIIYKAKLNDPDDIDVLNFSRGSAPSELLYGPLQMCCLMIWLGWYKFMTQESAIIAAAIGVGDGLAPMIGTHWGRHVYNLPLSNQKTIEGSVAGVFLGTVTACYVFLSMMGVELPPLRCVLVYGTVAAVVEGSSPGNFDNIITALVMHFSMDKVKEWLPP